ncbi:DUF7004 family protein [Rheinheimera texasensis]|uniref:DUF7004 family protein n=1 Tax=Rheinheimera texasensis TaxID=306205 RepID=UPI0004E23108|nr:hypothetical protein [Rheinheimera texasensis]
MHHETPHKEQFIQMFLYAGMVAEESKDKAILKKCIKRRGVNQRCSSSCRKKWRQIIRGGKSGSNCNSSVRREAFTVKRLLLKVSA